MHIYYILTHVYIYIFIQRFTVEVSPENLERKHIPDTFLFTCTTHLVEMLHKKS